MNGIGKLVCSVLALTGVGIVCPSPALADNVPATIAIAGTTLSAIPPDGACAYDELNLVDRQLIEVMKKGNEGYNNVLYMFSSCKDLGAMRSGAYTMATGDYGQILSPVHVQGAERLSRVDYVRKVAEYYRQNPDIFDKATDKAKDAFKSATNDSVKLSGVKRLGILKSEPDFVSVGLLETVEQGGKSVVVAGVVTTTKLNVPVTINLYYPYTDEKSLTALAERAATYARKLVALNPDNTRSSSIDLGESMNAGVIGAIMGGLVGIVYKLFRKRKSGNEQG